MKMQVPEGEPLAGMAHHKIHDKAWTALATRPDEDSVERFLRPVCYQDFPAALLPEALQDTNPLHLWRLVEGKLGQE